MKMMMRRNMLVGVVLALVLMCTGLVFAQKPVKNVSPRRHPNLAAAQRLSAQAYDKLVAAQKANEFDLGGHAQKAKDLLEQANQEIKQAAEAANADHK
jgi:F0F1-type ATP synthase membrane subunit b/b'